MCCASPTTPSTAMSSLMTLHIDIRVIVQKLVDTSVALLIDPHRIHMSPMLHTSKQGHPAQLLFPTQLTPHRGGTRGSRTHPSTVPIHADQQRPSTVTDKGPLILAYRVQRHLSSPFNRPTLHAHVAHTAQEQAEQPSQVPQPTLLTPGPRHRAICCNAPRMQ